MIRGKIINALYFIGASLVFEVAFFIYSFSTFLPILFFLDLLFLMTIASLIFFFKTTKFDKIYIPILLFVICMCFSLNTIFYKATGNIFILENLKNIGLILGRTEDHGQRFSWLIFSIFLAIYLCFLLMFFVINYKLLSAAKKNNISHYPLSASKIATIFLVSSISIFSLGAGLTSIVERRKNNFYIDSVSSAPVSITKKIGLLSYYVKNLMQIIFPPHISEEELINYFTDSSYLNDSFTGILSNYNVITITIETGGDYMLNPYTTPNLYYILENGINCSHNYSKNRTLYSELLGITGNIPSSEFKDTTIDYSLPYSLPKLLNNAEYDTAYFADIGNDNDVFNQKTLMHNIGYKNCCYHYELMPDKEEYDYGKCNWERDSDVFKLVIDRLDKMQDKFYIHYTTMCMHERYTDEPCRASLMQPLKDEFKESLDNFESAGLWTNPLKGKDPEENYYYNYTLCTMDFDEGLGLLLDYLKRTNKLNNTLIVVYGDHDCYGDTNPPMSMQIKHTNDGNDISIFSTILGFYNPILGETFKKEFSSNEFTKFSSPMVIVPTILDLLGIKYNPKFYQGKSIFDPLYNNEVFYSMFMQKFMNENYLSEIGTNIDKVFNDNGTKREFIDNCVKLLKQQKYIDFIYNNNIFKTYDYDKFMPTN